MYRGVVVMLVLAVWWGHEALASGPPFAPEVRPADQRLLESSMAVGETNALAAATLLDTGKTRSAALAFGAGNLYFQAGEYMAARKAYEEAIEKLPRFRAAKANLGRIYLLQEQPDQAILLYQDLVADGQADANIYLLLGHALQQQGRPVSAETAFRNALLLQPDLYEALIGLTQVLFEQDRFQEALALTREVLTVRPDHPDVWRLRANAFLLLEQHAKAIQTIEAARRLKLADVDMLALQGDLYLHGNQGADALLAYQAALETGAISEERMLRAIDGFLLLDDTQGAQALISVADTDSWSDDASATLLRLQAELHWRAEQFEAAHRIAQQAIAVNPLDGRALLLLASIAEAEGNLEMAILYCERAARIPASEVDALVRQAQLEVSRNRFAHAIQLLERAQQRREQPHVARYLAQLQQMQM